MDGGMHAGAAAFGQEPQEVGLFYKVKLARLASLCRRVVRGPGDGGVQSEHLPGLGNLEDEGLTLAGSRRQFHAASAQYVDTAARLSFDEQGRASRVCERELYLLEGFHFLFGQTTEETF